MHKDFPGVIDADGHVMEFDRELFEYLPPPYAGHSFRLSGSFPTDRSGRCCRPASA